MPQTALLLSIAGLSVTLSGFSGLVAAFRRGGEWEKIDAFRLRQIPEMALATALLVMATIALGDTLRRASAALQVAAVLAIAFTFGHAIALLVRARREGIRLTAANSALAISIDLAILGLGIVALILASSAAFEWLLVAMLTRPMLAFVLALTELPNHR